MTFVEMSSVFLVLVLIVLIFGGGLFIRTFLMRRAVFKVVEILYEHDAVGVKGAKTLQELGLERPDFFQRFTKPRDYKQNALQILLREGIINVDEGGRVYLVEEKLDQSLRRKRR